ncbi:hypothetical protein Tco_1228042 [Tanacetum coccineum]
MNRLKLNNLTQDVLTGPTYDLMKGTCKSVVELEYHLEEVFKAANDQLDWHNPEGRPYLHDLSKPLPLIQNARGRQVIPFDHFINNDLEYLKGGSLSQKYTTSLTKMKAANYGHVKWIKDKVPRSIWSPAQVVYDKHAYWGPKRQRFYGYATNMETSKDVYLRHRIIAITGLKIMEFFGYKHLEEIIVQRQDDQLYRILKDGGEDTLHLPMGTPENPFVVPANIHTIKAFMNRVGYQCVFNKVSDFYTKNLAQPWQTMFKKKEVIQYTRFIKLIIADLMKKSPNIPKRLEEDYHSIKDDVPLIRDTDDFKEYEMVFMEVDVPMNQPPLVTKKRKQIAGESNSPHKSLKITIKQKQIVEKDDDDSEDRIEPGSHKDNPEVVDDDDDKEREKKDDEMGSLEIRNEETQTTIPTPLSSPRKILSSDKKTFQELTDIVSNPTTSTSKHSQVKKRISSKYSSSRSASQDVQASRLYDSRHGKKVCHYCKVLGNS